MAVLTFAASRRALLPRVVALLAAVVALPERAAAQAYPSKPVRVIVNFAPGGTFDVFGRILAERLSQRMGQNFYVENVAGASGNIGTGQAARAAPDGHTLFLSSSPFVINPSLFASVPYDPVKDFAPVTLAVAVTHVISAHPSVPAKTLREVVAAIRASPGKYNFAQGGAGTPGHLIGEQLRLSLNLDMVAVPFNGAGPAVNSVVGGHTPLGFTTVTSAGQQIIGGQLRGIAVTSKARAAQLPDVQTTAEAGFPDIVGDFWVGVMAPAGTPAEILAHLQRETTQVLAEPATKEKLAKVGFETIASTPEAFAKQVAAELDSWRKVIQAAKVKAT
jgi:tripartite-type tricarboxylate transporter receptor subunit TctC